jgi:putative polyhydroxyalkanoate system protein
MACPFPLHAVGAEGSERLSPPSLRAPKTYRQVFSSKESPNMANIQIKRTHDLGLDDARTEVEKIAQSLKSEIQADYFWNGNKLQFKRSGASGTIDVGADYINMDIKLGMAFSMLKEKIEKSINHKLDAALS